MSDMRPSSSRAGAAHSPSAPAATPESDLARAVDGVRRIVRALRLAEQRTRSEAGLSAAQLFVLARLAESSAASLSDLAARVMTDRTSVAAIIERLEQARLVASERAATDRRRVAVRITPLGRRTLLAAPPAPTALLVDALGSLSPAELRGLTAHLERLVDAMGLVDEPARMLFEDDRPAPARRRPHGP